MSEAVKQALLVLLRAEQARMQERFNHLSYAPDPLRVICVAIRELEKN